MEIYLLEESFTLKGDKFKKAFVSDKAYLFIRLHGDTYYYEVFLRKTSEVLSDFENKIGSGDFKERYPKDNDFGVWAWCFRNRTAAIEKFNTL